MMEKLISYFVNWKIKIIVLVVYTAFVVGSTLHIHNKFIDADRLKQAEMQLEKAQEVPSKIIKFNQDVRKTNAAKDPCFNTSIPTDALRLLQR